MSRRLRRRKQTKRGRKAKLVWTGFCISSLLLVLLVAPSTSYNVAEFGRQNGVDVTTDDTALVGLQKAASIEEGQESRFVTVENNFGQTEIQLTVELTPPSRSEGHLVVNGTNEGNAYQFTLLSTGTQDVSACFVDDSDGIPADVTFNTTFSGTSSAVSGTLEERAVPIVNEQSESTKC